MGKQQRIPLVLNVAEGDVSGEETLINVFPRKSGGGKYAFTLVNSAGLAFVLDLPTAPVKAMIAVNDRAFAVTATTFYEIFLDGRFSVLGDVVLTGPVSIAQNGFEIAMVDGNQGYSYDLVAATVNRITDSAFYPAKTVTFQDGYFIFERGGTDQFFISGLNSINFDGSDFARAEGQPDNAVAVISDHRELLVFGTETVEIYYNSGALDFPFVRNQGAFIEKGCAARYSIAKQNNTVYFIGSDLIVYQLNGYQLSRISSHAVEDDIRDVNLDDATAYTHSEGGHLFYYLTIPAIKKTWCYDIAGGIWHIEQSKAFGRSRVSCALSFGGKNLVGDFQSGSIYELTTNALTENGDSIVREFILPTVSLGRGRFTVDSFELDVSGGVGTTLGKGVNPQVGLSVSKDDGNTFSNVRLAAIGKKGDYYTRVIWRRLGLGRSFIFKITISDPVPLSIGGAYISVS